MKGKIFASLLLATPTFFDISGTFDFENNIEQNNSLEDKVVNIKKAKSDDCLNELFIKALIAAFILLAVVNAILL